MSDHIGEATKKVIDLDALEKLADRMIENATVQRIFEYRRNTGPATIKALIAELKEARGLLTILDDHLGDDDGMWSDDSSISTEWIGSNGIRRTLSFGLFRRIRAFLARNGKGEG